MAASGLGARDRHSRLLVVSVRNNHFRVVTPDGLCCPSVKAIQEKTGLSRSAIFEALNRLEAAGIVKRVRRLVRRLVDFGGLVRLTTVQSSSLYSFWEPSATAHMLPIRKKVRSSTAKLLSNLARSLSTRTESAVRSGIHFGFQNRGAFSEVQTIGAGA